MLAAWMIHAILFGAILAGAAVLLEAAVRMLRLPARGVWAAVVGASLAVPVLTLLGRGGSEVTTDLSVLEPLVLALPLLAAPAETLPGMTGFERPLLFLWIGLSTALLVWTVHALFRLRVMQGEWREEEVDGAPVFVSRTVGPAVVGWLPGRIVLPEWVLRGDLVVRELVLAHEVEHLRARDTLVVGAAGVAVLAMPWNLPLWWSLRRLRSAVEVDCDRRVLRSRPTLVRQYGELLLEVGARGWGRPGMARLSGGRSTLERRIRELTRDPLDRRPVRTLLPSGGAVLLVSIASAMPAPASPLRGALPADPPAALPATLRAEPPANLPAGAPLLPGDGASALAEGPRFIPYTVAPTLRNTSEVQRALEQEYPPVLRDAGIGGQVFVHFFIDARGGVQDMRIASPSGHPALDQAALRVAGVFRFSPAFNMDRPTPVWVSLPITFQSR